MSCRLCGATHAKPSVRQKDVCASCESDIEFHLKADRLITDADITAFVIRRLKAELNKRYDRATIGRCEAIRPTGYQCAGQAIATRDSHKCCATHLRIRAPVFAGGGRDFGSTHLERFIRLAIQRDPGVRAAIEAALS